MTKKKTASKATSRARSVAGKRSPAAHGERLKPGDRLIVEKICDAAWDVVSGEVLVLENDSEDDVRQTYKTRARLVTAAARRLVSIYGAGLALPRDSEEARWLHRSPTSVLAPDASRARRGRS